MADEPAFPTRATSSQAEDFRLTYSLSEGALEDTLTTRTHHQVEGPSHAKTPPINARELQDVPLPEYQAVSISELPNELILQIMEALPVDTLRTLAAVSSLFRQLSIPIYLRRLDVIKNVEEGLEIRLHDQTPRVAISFLSSMAYPSFVTLSFDLYFLLASAELHYCSRVVAFSEVTIVIPDCELYMLSPAATSDAVRSFLASISHSGRCTSITIETAIRFADPRDIPCSRNEWATCVPDSQILALASTVISLSLDTVLLDIERLWKTIRLLLSGPSVVDLYLNFHSRRNASKIIAATRLPALNFLGVRSPFPVKLPNSFLQRHPRLGALSLFSSSSSSDSKDSKHLRRRTMAASTVKPAFVLSKLTHLHLSVHFRSVVSALNPSSYPKLIRISTTTLFPPCRSDRFCETLSELSLCLAELSLRRISGEEISISFPWDLDGHLHHFHHDNACMIPDAYHLPGFKRVMLGLNSVRNASTLVCYVMRSFFNHYANLMGSNTSRYGYPASQICSP